MRQGYPHDEYNTNNTQAAHIANSSNHCFSTIIRTAGDRNCYHTTTLPTPSHPSSAYSTHLIHVLWSSITMHGRCEHSTLTHSLTEQSNGTVEGGTAHPTNHRSHNTSQSLTPSHGHNMTILSGHSVQHNGDTTRHKTPVSEERQRRAQ